MRTFAGMFVGGIAALVLFKLFAGLVLPLLGIVVGLFMMAVKITIFVAVGYFIYTLVRNRDRERTTVS
jgi:hypothetical protein